MTAALRAVRGVPFGRLSEAEDASIVQCKEHSKPVGPAVARELYGSLVASGADSAILACTSGFTIGVFDFVRDKSIELVDVEAIVRLQEKLNLEQRHSPGRG